MFILYCVGELFDYAFGVQDWCNAINPLRNRIREFVLTLGLILLSIFIVISSLRASRTINITSIPILCLMYSPLPSFKVDGSRVLFIMILCKSPFVPLLYSK